MEDHFSTYLYQKRGFFYFPRRVPKEVQRCHSKQAWCAKCETNVELIEASTPLYKEL